MAALTSPSSSVHISTAFLIKPRNALALHARNVACDTGDLAENQLH